MAQATPDVAVAIAYPVSNQASFVTGAYLTVDGGNLIIEVEDHSP